MARFNEILVGRYNRLLQKLLSMKGGPVAAQLASEVQPVIPFFHGVENRYLEGWDLFGFSGSNGGVAAVSTTLQIRNPAGSNMVAVFERLSFFTSAADSVVLRKGFLAPDLLVQVLGVTREDPRGRVSPSLVFSISDATHVPSLVQAFGIVLAGPALLGKFIDTTNQEVPLLPGDMLQVTCNTIGAEGLTWSLRWRERLLEDSERA
jgi:hypothetical protein